LCLHFEPGNDFPAQTSSLKCGKDGEQLDERTHEPWASDTDDSCEVLGVADRETIEVRIILPEIFLKTFAPVTESAPGIYSGESLRRFHRDLGDPGVKVTRT